MLMMLRILVLFLLGALPTQAERHGLYVGQIRNIITDHGATCDGSANDASAFSSFNTWAVANQGSGRVTLYIPSGKTCCFKQGSPAMAFADGIRDFLLIGYGATISDCTTGAGFFLGATRGVWFDNTHHAKLQTATAGDTTVTLVTASETSRFTVGDWAMISGVKLQSGGDPPNHALFEFVKVASIGSGTITLESRLRNTYKSTWPLTSSGDAFHSYPGGPAVLYVLGSSWNASFEYRGITISKAGQTYANGRSVTYRDVTVLSPSSIDDCIVPTQNLIWRAINVTATDCRIEVDKLVDRIDIRSSTLKRILVQSSSVRELYIRDTSLTDYINGSPLITVAYNVSMPFWQVGAYAYGASQEITITSSSIPSVTNNNSANAALTSYSMADGVISLPFAQGPPNWAVPGMGAYFRTPGGVEHAFTVVDMTDDGANTLITTDLAGGFPASVTTVHAARPSLTQN